MIEKNGSDPYFYVSFFYPFRPKEENLAVLKMIIRSPPRNEMIYVLSWPQQVLQDATLPNLLIQFTLLTEAALTLITVTSGRLARRGRGAPGAPLSISAVYGPIFKILLSGESL